MFRRRSRFSARVMLLVAFALAACSVVCSTARAAKLRVHFVTPTTNSDGSPLTDLAAIRIEWGTCNGLNWGTYVGGVNFPTSQIGVAGVDVVYPTGLNPICLRCFAMNSSNVFSLPSPTVVIELTAAGKPIVLN